VNNQWSQTGSEILVSLLVNLNEAGGFPIALLTDHQGFPIAAAAADNQDPQHQAAIVALIQKTVAQASDQLGLDKTDEFSLFDASGQRLVCRPFSINGDDMILAILIPNRQQSYRRLTNNTLSAVRRQWEL
jgi:predicted regulator of Ras-like GTPase activity (Roadblock/LC7/MglB family)